MFRCPSRYGNPYDITHILWDASASNIRALQGFDSGGR
jgi:hypothetical protein